VRLWLTQLEPQGTEEVWYAVTFWPPKMMLDHGVKQVFCQFEKVTGTWALAEKGMLIIIIQRNTA
jgi:hypothetical protein